ncbi:hypothetical protein F3Y22_tig00111311pilonHSYRG00247 [Hibiscus syriacus]|uniref:RNase H type-1 domain-containing protein n=1 Tax=Hibiscus syriacus TaxID=106335 RepID=A0A6A2YQL4_HIBSY|nr:hypothetical protein F3Y22_tig00111311pilonHSYRG00247 [Hibiscus syriacus]
MHFGHPKTIINTRRTSVAEEVLQLALHNGQAGLESILLYFESKLCSSDDYTFLLRELGNRSKVELAKGIFQTVINKGYGNNVYAFSALISAFGRSGYCDEAIKVFDSMKNYGLRPNLVTYNVVIDACTKGGVDFKRVVEIFDKMLRRGVQALLGKWVWKFASEKRSWWKEVMCNVNNLDPNSLLIGNNCSARASWIWRGVRFPRLFALSNNKRGKVAEFRMNSNSGWVWDIQMRRNLVDWEVEQWLQLISLLNNTNLSLLEENCWIWLGNGEGCFSAKSCITKFYDQEGNDGEEGIWDRHVWAGVVPPRVEVFVWQVAHQRVAVKDELLKRSVTGIDHLLCPMCGKCEESISHMFLHCEVVWFLWFRFLRVCNVSFVVLKKMIDFLISWDDLVPGSTIWKFIPRAVLWSVWKCGNEITFQKIKVDSAMLFFLTRFRTATWFGVRFKNVKVLLDSLIGDLKLADSNRRQKKGCSLHTKWVPPLEDFLKLNFDWAMAKGWDKGGIGGLIRDDRGLLLGSFSEKIGDGPTILVELMAINRSLNLIEEVGSSPRQRIILESDSTTALKWIKNPDLCTPLFQTLVIGVATNV